MSVRTRSAAPARRWLGVCALTVAVLATAVLPVSSAYAADSADRAGQADRGDRSSRAASSFTLTGRGYGHGHGMSQWGAQGAARQGRTYRQIVNFYYPGTSWGRAGGAVRVLISADTSPDVVVGARRGLQVKSLGSGRSFALRHSRAVRWRIQPAGGDSRVSFRTKNAWHAWRTLPGDAQFSAGGKAIRLYYSRTSVAYRGVLRSAGGDTVNVLSLDAYLRGVVPQEVPALWHPQAVQAQSVAARTYAAYERAHPLARHYQICDTSACQVYGGASAEHPAATRAVKATAGRVLLSGGRPAFTQFSASSGGWTSAGSAPYLRAQQDPYDGWSGNPYRTWRATISAAALQRAFPNLGTVRGLSVTKRDGHGRWGGRAVVVRIQGSERAGTVSGDSFRSIFGLRSTYFTVG